MLTSHHIQVLKSKEESVALFLGADFCNNFQIKQFDNAETPAGDQGLVQASSRSSWSSIAKGNLLKCGI